jgi:FkbM family methyltransferase
MRPLFFFPVIPVNAKPTGQAFRNGNFTEGIMLDAQGLERFRSWLSRRGRYSLPLRWLASWAVLLWKALRRCPLVSRTVVPLRVGGQQLWVRCFSYDDLLMATPEYESCLKRLCPRPGEVVVDAGACIGRHTLWLARAVGPQGKLIALEPLPANFRMLRRNVRANRLANVVCIPAALGATRGQVELRFDYETSTASSRRELPGRAVVDQWSLDLLLAELGVETVDIIKLDVEGMEIDALEGARQTLAASPHARIVVEVHSHSRQLDGQCRLRKWLEEHDYQIEETLEGRRLFYWAHRRLSDTPTCGCTA